MKKALYMGLPLKIDESTEPPSVSGPGSWLMLLWYNGTVMEYEGSYWAALWHWLFRAE